MRTVRETLRAAVLTAGVLLGLGGAPAAGQLPPTLPPAAPVETLPVPVVPAEPANPSKVFPDDGFPDSPSQPEGGIPASTPPLKGPTAPPLIHSPLSDYGYESGYPLGTPGEREPGPYYRPPYSRLPSYLFSEEYYDRPVVSPRGALIYAPPGYEARDQQVTPGTPEFTPVTPPEPLSPEDASRFVSRGIMPGSFLVPGTGTSFRLRGFVRLMALYDFDPIGSADSFVPSTIPVPQQSGKNFNMGARYSRIAFESWTPTSLHEWTVHTFVEGDFFNGPAQAAGGGGNPFRLRHAFVDFGYFRVGQQNTVFMDASTWPSVVDFQGPAGWANARRPGARMTLPVFDQLYWAFGVEQPFSDITTNGLGTNVQDVPDFASHVRYETDYGHVQVGGLMRAIGYRPTNGAVTRQAGYGLSAGTTFHPWAILAGSNPTRKANPNALERCRLIGQWTVGRGIGRYLQDTAGAGLDGQVNAIDGDFDLPYASGFVVSYEHWYSEKWLSAITYSQVLVGTNGGQPGTTYVGGKYFTANVWYNPINNMSFGVEYIYGERENVNTQSGSASRVNALVQYNF